MKKVLFIISAALLLVAGSCKKGPGEGGKSQIIGKIWVENYNTLNHPETPYEQYVLKSEYPGVDKSVYLIFGDDISYGIKTKAGPDGQFEFNYLRPGSYKVYVQSKDTTRNTVSGFTSMEVNITLGKKDTWDTGNIVIYN